MQKIIKVLSLALPEAAEICCTVEESILKPIVSGQQLPCLLSHQLCSRCLMSMLKAVMPVISDTPDREDMSISGARPEEGSIDIGARQSPTSDC